MKNHLITTLLLLLLAPALRAADKDYAGYLFVYFTGNPHANGTDMLCSERRRL